MSLGLWVVVAWADSFPYLVPRMERGKVAKLIRRAVFCQVICMLKARHNSLATAKSLV